MNNTRSPVASPRGLSVLSACLLSVLLASCSEQQAPADTAVVRPVKVMTLSGAAAAGQRQYPGKVRAAQRVDLSFEVAGKLVELPIREGQVVKQGDLVAKLDDRDLTSNLKSARAENVNAAANFKRASALIKDGHISKTDYDSLRAKKDVAAADLAKAIKAVDDTKLYAPFGGRVASRFVENFQDIRAKEPIVSLQDISDIEILVDVPERRAIRAGRPGAKPPKLMAVFDGVPGRDFELKLKEFSTEADPTTQTFQAVLSMPQPEGLSILPGMTALVLVDDAEPATTTDQTGFSLPAAAVFSDEAGKPHVWVVNSNDNRVQRRAIETGALAGQDSIRVESGLEAGEVIAVSAVTRLREGMEIRPVDKVEF